MVALGQRLRRFAEHISHTVGEDHGKRVRNWFEEKKSGWSAVLEAPQMPAMSTVYSIRPTMPLTANCV